MPHESPFARILGLHAHPAHQRFDIGPDAFARIAEVPDAHDDFHLIVARQSLHTLEKTAVRDTLAPWMRRAIAKYGVIAIETWYAEPYPRSPIPATSFWPVEELLRLFPHAWVCHRREEEAIGIDQTDQQRRLFRHSEIILVMT